MDLDLTNQIFSGESKAREHLESIRWPNGPICPHCGALKNVTKLEGKSHRPGLYKCNDCQGHFTVTVGTVFEDSKVPLHKWVLAAHLMAASKKGYSAHQLHRTIKVSYKTAWFMMHRLREAMTTYQHKLLGGSNGPNGQGGIVEADETYWGNIKGQPVQRGGYRRKMKVLSLVERGGNVRSFHIQEANVKTVKKILKERVSPLAHLMTDDAPLYKGMGKRLFPSHQTVRHTANEYVRGNVHTNTIESFFAVMKRGLVGTYHHVGEQHLQRYVREFDFRYNYRSSQGFDDTYRASMLLKGIQGKRLTYS